MADLPPFPAEVCRRLRAAGHEAYFVGGWVRDLLLGRPGGDVDIATNAPPAAVQALFPRTNAVGKSFGVILVQPDSPGASRPSPAAGPGALDGRSETLSEEPAAGGPRPGTAAPAVGSASEKPVEVATFRTDGPYTDARRPDSVRFATRDEDASRRDFTVNGMFYDPATGAVIDTVGGRDDLAARRIRAIGDPETRFREDRLRILRAVRFAAELGFELEPGTAGAVARWAPAVHDVAVERIAAELRRMLACPGRRRAVELLDGTGLLRRILPEMDPMKGCEQPPSFHPEGDVWIHSLLALEHMESGEFVPCFAALLHDVGKPPTFTPPDLSRPVDHINRIRFNEHDRVGADMARRICDRLRLSHDERESVVWLIAKHMVFTDVQRMRPGRLKTLLAHPLFPDLLAVHKADKRGADGDLSTWEFCRAKQAEWPVEARSPEPLVHGEDILALGVPAGPKVGEILRAVREAQLDGDVAGRAAALDMARKLATPP